jgi:hypothetical protein
MEGSNLMLMEAVKKYLSSDITAPYFLVVDDGQYKEVKDKLAEQSFDFVKISDFCGGNDKLPDIDRLLEHLKTADVNIKNGKLTVIGLGEYLALCGGQEADKILSVIKDLNVGNTKVVLLLRGITDSIKKLQARDKQRFDNRRLHFSDNGVCDLSITLAPPSIGLSALPGIKVLLSRFESGICGQVVVNTAVNLDNSLFTVHRIIDAYEGVKFTVCGFILPRSCGDDKQWIKLLDELTQNSGSIDTVLEKYGFGDNLEADFCTRVVGSDYRNWLYFIALKLKPTVLQNGYLRFVLEITSRFDDFKRNVLNAIIGVPHTDKRFSSFYRDRKALAAKFPESDIAAFVVDNRRDVAESVYKLTDATRAEREEIVVWVSRNGLIPQIADIYPTLTDYLKKYVFNCGELSDMLTRYFDAYKHQKISNTLKPDFLSEVEKIARPENREYNRLPTRNEIIDGLDKTDTYLYWLDALGVEYLAFISELCRKRGLSLSVKIVRAELPTITALNRDFFDAWQGYKNGENGDKQLDNVKHKDAGGYNFQTNDLPIHLARELDVIADVIEKAATELAYRNYRRFLIVSDHGASRLAVLKKQEEQYATDTKGEHSGRCCKLFEPYDLPFAAQENGYLVLADYGRFKGSRAANVEVHGGASLEEVVVPIIELALKDSSITVELVDFVVTASYRKNAEITLYSKSPLAVVSVIVNGKRYPATKMDDHHYKVSLSDIKRAGEYPADVYNNDDLIGKLTIKVHNESGKKNDAFDELF